MNSIPDIEDKVEALKLYLIANVNDEEGDSWIFGHNPSIINHLNSFNQMESEILTNELSKWQDDILSNLADPVSDCTNELIDGYLIYCNIFLRISNFDDLEYLIQNLAAVAANIKTQQSNQFYDQLISKAEIINQKLNSNYNHTIDTIKNLRQEQNPLTQ